MPQNSEATAQAGAGDPVLGSTLIKTEGDDAPAFLANLQGNILNGHGRDYVCLLFVRFPRPALGHDDKADVRVREWVAKLARERITSAKKQFDDAKKYRDQREKIEKYDKTGDPSKDRPVPFDGGGFAHISLSVNAYLPAGQGGLGWGEVPVPGAPANGEDVFAIGMKQRQRELFDPALTSWDKGFRDDADALVILADDLPNRLILAEEAVLKELKELGASVLVNERGHTLWKKFDRPRRGEAAYGIPVEHFGYADGVSQPVFTEHQYEEYLKQNPDLDTGDPTRTRIAGRQWDPVAPLGLVLVPDPNAEGGYGSYLVFRKLEQNVRAFKRVKAEIASRLGISKALAGAMAVGRFEDATALVQEPGDGSERVTNNFNYEADAAGLRCPFHSHIRKSNPRLESVGIFADLDEVERGHRIARRGVPYGGVLNDSEDPDELPNGGVGLHFMCYQSNIANQFEFIQRLWCNNPNFLRPGPQGPGEGLDTVTGLDAIVGQRLPGVVDPLIGLEVQPPSNWPAGWGKPTSSVTNIQFADLVTMKGGEYFFSPSIEFLKNLG